MKQIKLLFLMLIGILVSINLSSCSNEDDEPNEYADAIVNGIAYQVVDLDAMTAEVVYDRFPQSSYSGAITIPSTVNINGKPFTVVYIGASAFKGCKITSISFPSTLLYISGSAFAHCNKLTTVTIPANIKEVGGASFEACSNLKELIISDSDETLTCNAAPVSAFYDCPIAKAYIGRSNYLDFRSQSDNKSYLKEITFGKKVVEFSEYIFPLEAMSSITCKGVNPPHSHLNDYSSLDESYYRLTCWLN